MSKRANLRSLILGAQDFREEKIEIDGVEYGVRAPSVKQRSEILKASGATAGKDGEVQKADLAETQVAAVIALTFEPGTSEKIFEPADRDALLAMPCGGPFDKLSEIAMRMLNVSAGEVSKN